MIVAEDDVCKDALDIANKYFFTRSARIFGCDFRDHAHKNLIVCTKTSESKWEGLRSFLKKDPSK